MQNLQTIPKVAIKYLSWFIKLQTSKFIVFIIQFNSKMEVTDTFTWHQQFKFWREMNKKGSFFVLAILFQLISS